MVTRCYLCGGRTAKKLVTAENWWGDELALVEHVPAWVCESCGEAYFDAETCKLRIPRQNGHRFHTKSATDSTGNRPPVPRQIDHV